MIEKIQEPNIDEIRECPRCSQSFCPDCVDFNEVDFKIFDGSENNPNVINWKGTEVCPFCYNQLIDLKAKKGRS